MQNILTVPGLGLTFNIDRIAFSLGGLSVRWYGVIIALGFLLAVWYCLRRCRDVGLKTDDLIDLLIFCVPIAIIGARAYYVIFMYDQLYYYDTAAIFRIWDGGLAIYGAIIFALITTFVFARIRRIRLGALLDIGAMGLLIGQAIGRWGNFVNQEAYGGVTNHFMRMGIYVNGVLTTVHPTFLYESVWNALGFLLLHLYFKRRRYSGEIFLLYAGWYGLGRGIIEGMRTDSLYFFGSGLRISQFVGFFSLILAAGLLIYFYLFREREPEQLTNPYLPRPEKKRRGAPQEPADEAVESEAAPEETQPAGPQVVGGITFADYTDDADEDAPEDAGADDDADDDADEADDGGDKDDSQ